MTDIWNRTTKWIDHNRFTALGLFIIATLLALYAAGCQPKTTSPTTGEKVDAATLAIEQNKTGAALKAEAAALEAKYAALAAELRAQTAALDAKAAAAKADYEAAFADIENQQARWEAMFGVASEMVTAVRPELGALLGAIGLIFGVSRGADARRKDTVIARYKHERDRLMAASTMPDAPGPAKTESSATA
jgi:hypothetical protein